MLPTSPRSNSHHQSLTAKAVVKVLQIGLLIVIALLLLGGTSGCSRQWIRSVQQMIQTQSITVKTLASFQRTLVTKYRERDIRVQVQEQFTEQGRRQEIVVDLINTTWNDLSETDRETTATEIAGLAADHFSLTDPRSIVIVQFIEHRNFFGFVNYQRVVDAYTLPINDVTPVTS